MDRPRPVLILTAAILAFTVASCQNPFGYYVGGNKYPLTNLTSETAPAAAVLPPVFYAIPTTGGSARTVVGTPTERSDQEIAIQTPTGEAIVYYTYTKGIGIAEEPLDPRPYTEGTYRYDPSHPIVVCGNNTVVRVKAVAMKSLMIPSSISTLEMRISYGSGEGPSFDKPAGVYQSPFTLTITDLTPYATIWYTTDGSEPVPNDGKTSFHDSPLYLGVGASTMVRAVTTAPQLTMSSETAAEYLFTPPAPPPPRVAVGPGEATVSWQPVSGATSYNLYYRAGSAVTPSDGAKAVSPSTTKIVSGLAGATQYAFTVTAVNANGESLASPVVTAVPLLPAPEGFILSPASSQAVLASWLSQPGAASYRIYRDVSQTGGFTTLAWSGTAAQALITGLSAGSAYYFRICAVDQAGTAGALGAPIAGTSYALDEMPAIASVPNDGTLTRPTQLPPGADPASDYWIRTVTLGWTQGGYTYAVWDHDALYSSAFMVVAYDAGGAIASQWMFNGNSWISSISVDEVSGNISFVNDWDGTTSVVPWSTLKL